MEAIQPGSSTVVKSPDATTYEDHVYSYAIHVAHKPESPSVVIYDEPDVVQTNSRRAQVKRNPTPEPARYDEPSMVMSTQAQSALQKQCKATHPPPAAAAVLYDEPALIATQSQKMSQKQTKVKDTLAEYDEPILMSADVHLVSQKQVTHRTSSPTPQFHEGGSDDDNGDKDDHAFDAFDALSG